MGKKKQKPSAFSEFMFEYIAKERRAGRSYPKEQWSRVADPHWKRLSEDQRKKYAQQAKAKPTRTVNVPAKYTSQGVPLEEIDRLHNEKVQNYNRMLTRIKELVEEGFLDNDIATKPFYFMMANYFYKTHEGVYSPAEIAVCSFNFREGVTKLYHTFINPGSIKCGYAADAVDLSKSSHQLPPPPKAMGEKLFDVVYTKILDVLGIADVEQTFSANEKRPCVFARKEDIPMLKSILDQLCGQGSWEESHFDLFELEILFNQLKNSLIDFGPSDSEAKKLPINVTSYFIEQDKYDMVENISCDFHEEKDATKYCPLSYVRRWFYLFADHVCESIDVKLLPGIHLPDNAAVGPSTNFNGWEDEKQGVDDDEKSYDSIRYQCLKNEDNGSEIQDDDDSDDE